MAGKWPPFKETLLIARSGIATYHQTISLPNQILTTAASLLRIQAIRVGTT